MGSTPLVSIITVVHNGERHIADAIRSVAEQTYRNIEYIIIDGGSTDNTLAVIRQFETGITTVISERDKGISDAFNKGIRRARGSIIGMINADDWYAPDAVEKAVDAIGEYDVAYGDLQLWHNDRASGIVKGDHRHLYREMSVNHPTVFVRRECYQQFGLFDEQYRCAMDYDFLLRLVMAGRGFVHVPGVLANMRWGGVSDVRWRLACWETMQIKDKYLPSRKLAHRLYYVKQVMAITISRMRR